ncbi:lytic transglycosylase domain-containing protein [Candidatus Electronema sp. PJ]|uniref:lytic transglycosylase domain-containing protein n=1 Tax=Candidatus Electronema sp. PJ TaxID=3401572 RepID=UPI003AA92095
MLLAVRKLIFALFVLVAAPAFAQVETQGYFNNNLPIQQAIPQNPSPSFEFPVYPVMFPNVRFWEKVYGTYTENQGVLHDKNDLDRIYRVINLLPKDTLGAGKINEKLVEMAQFRCQAILKKFAAGGIPQTSDEIQIYALFKQKNPAVFLAAVDNMRVQTGLKSRFRDGVIRSGAYLPAIRRILRMNNLPLELAYLPHVESSFNPVARSKAGAVGLWQFTSYTGKEFMKINELVDERYDLYAASNAAALFLKENYRQLGSWPLALTAYNHGRGGMMRAKREWGGSYSLIFANHTGKNFGFASRNFYSEFVAAFRVAQRIENDPTVIRERPLISASVQLKDYASAPELCQYFGVSEEEFRRLNPALLKPVLEGKKYIPRDVVIHLPATHFIRERIRAMPASLLYNNQLPDILPPKPQLRRIAARTRSVHTLRQKFKADRHLSKKKPVRSRKAKPVRKTTKRRR